MTADGMIARARVSQEVRWSPLKQSREGLHLDPALHSDREQAPSLTAAPTKGHIKHSIEATTLQCICWVAHGFHTGQLLQCTALPAAVFGQTRNGLY